MFAHYTHTTATTTISSLDDDGEAILVGKSLDIFKLLDGAWGSWHYGDIALDGKFSCRDFVTESVDGVRRGTYELEPKVSNCTWKKKVVGIG